MQLFTKQPNRWAERECVDDECACYRAAFVESGVAVVSAHDSYLINLASPDDALRARSLESFVLELRRCEQLEIRLLVSHPGNHMSDAASGLARNADALATALERVPGRTRVLLETTAGSGTSLGATFRELAELIERLPPAVASRVGVCLDTAHVFAAGYDIAGDYDGVLAAFDDTIGLARLGMIHLNDSKAPLASRRDRHELIGEGQIGEGAFRRLMTDPRLVAVPKVIETPKLDDAETTDRRMLERLRGYLRD